MGASQHSETSKEIRDGEHTCSNDIVNDQNLLSRLNAIALHLKEVFAIFLLVSGRLAGSRQLAFLPHRHEARTNSQCQTRAKQESSCFQSYNDIGLLLGCICFEDVQLQGPH
jgi:hypothetical protein